MRVAVIGAGGVGGYFGARLAAAGEEVVLVARGGHAAAMREHGLRVLSPLGDVTVRPVTLLDDLAKPGWFDVVLIAVKMYDLDAAAERARALVNGEAAVVPLQNGGRRRRSSPSGSAAGRCAAVWPTSQVPSRAPA